MSFRISSAESDGNESTPFTSAGLFAVAMMVPSGRNSTRTPTPAAAAALKRRLASDCVKFARRLRIGSFVPLVSIGTGLAHALRF
jgi:hypothetical protein